MSHFESSISAVAVRDRLIGPGHPPFIIAEACNNHEGDVRVAERMVRVAHAMGADCIKFQIHILHNEMLREVPRSDNFDEPMWDMLERTSLTIDEHVRLKRLCEELGIIYLCTPFSRDGADLLEEIGVDFYKTGSGELTNLPLIEHIAKKKKPMIVSTGMSEVDEVRETVNLVKSVGAPLILTHCTSIYPTPYPRVNLGVIERYADEFRVPVGLSDHSRGIYTVLGAVAVGACVLEKHFTFDRMARGPDHASSIEPYELGEMVKGARAVFEASGTERTIFPEEQQILAWARESVVSEVHIPRGTRIDPGMVWVKRPAPADGVVAAKDLQLVIGRTTAIDIAPDTQIKWADLE